MSQRSSRNFWFFLRKIVFFISINPVLKKIVEIIYKTFEILEHLGFISAFVGIILLVNFLTTGIEFVILEYLDYLFIFIIFNKIFYGFFNLIFQKYLQKKLFELLMALSLLLFYLSIHYIVKIDFPDSLKNLFENFALFLRVMTYVLYLFSNREKILQYLKKIRLSPAQSFSIGFVFLIFFGVWLLSLPFSTHQPVSFIDKLFIATSAVCVTGLVTVDVGSVFTPFGHGVILFLIQIGGISIITLYNFLLLISGEKLGFKQRNALLEIFNQQNFQILKKLLFNIIISTLVIEIIGAVFIFFSVSLNFDSLGEKIFFSFFHSVSAFCNAGFSTLSDGLVGFSTHYAFNFTICFLIIAGGIGFPVLMELKDNLFRKKSRRNYSLFSKVAFLMTGILIFLGMVVFFFNEYDKALKDFSLPDKLLVSFFQSVTPRTAGFNTISIGSLLTTTHLWIIILMFIGGSPASTAGGLRTTTFFLNILAFYQVMRKNITDIFVFQRKIKLSILLESAMLFFSRVFFIFMLVILLIYIEKKDFVPIFFEVVSAFSTVGLTTGLTPLLSSYGKIVIIFAMFIGRIGIMNIFGMFLGRATEEEKLVEYKEGYILTE